MAQRNNLDARIAILAGRQHGALTTAQAKRLGATPRAIAVRLESGRWEPVHRGVYRIAGAPRTTEQDIMAAVLASGSGAVASSFAAARLWELDGFDGGPPVHVTIPPHRRVRVPGVRVHRSDLSRGDRRRRSGIPVTSPVRTVLDLGRVLPGRRLESVVEDVVRNGLASYAAIHRRLSERMGSGFDGCRALRELLEERGLGSRPTGSELELAFEKLVERYGLPKPVRQYPVRHHGKAYRIDEAFPEARIAVELDGYRDHSRKPPFVQDRRKQNVLVLLDWLPLRFTYDDVHLQPAETARTLRTAYQQRTHPPDA